MKHRVNAKTLLSTIAILTLPVLAITIVVLGSSVDEAIVDATAPVGSVTLAPGQAGVITINLTVTGRQEGTATFKVYKDWSLSGGTFTGSNPQTFTVDPRAAQDSATTFATSGTVSVAAGQADGTFTLSAGAFEITNSNQTGAKLSAGTSASYTVTVETPEPPTPPADTTAPVVKITFPTPDGLNSWFVTSPVVGSVTATDNSDIASMTSDPADILSNYINTGASASATLTVSADGTTDIVVQAKDAANNMGQDTATIKIDTRLPLVTIALLDTGNGMGVYLLNEVVSGATWSAEDPTPGSGLATGAGPFALTIDTSSVGAKTAEVAAGSASDVAGNLSVKKTAPYAVYYAWGGFLSPVTAGGKGLFKMGSTVPVKFAIFDASGAPVSTAVASIFVAKMTNATEYGDYELITSTSSATTGNLFRYSDGLYIFNLGTKGLSTGTWHVEVRLDDGTTHSIIISLK
jgi:hypothetical protein